MCSHKFRSKNKPFVPRDKNDQICTTALYIHGYILWFLYTFKVCSKLVSEIWHIHPVTVVGAVITHKHSVHWGINPPQKHHPIFFTKLPPHHPLLNLQTFQVLTFSGNSPLYIVFLWSSPWKKDFSVNPHNIKIFHP